MNNRDRFSHALRFESVDRLPRWQWAAWWNLTIERWATEGLPIDLSGPRRTLGVAIMEHFGLDPAYQCWFPILKPTYPRMEHGQGPVSDIESYEAVREHLYPEIDWEAAVPEWVREPHARGELAVWFTVDGFFWFPRRLMGIERHLYAALHDPNCASFRPVITSRISWSAADVAQKLVSWYNLIACWGCVHVAPLWVEARFVL